MPTTSYLRDGFRIAGRHKRLVVLLWLAPLIPALLLGALAASNLAPPLGRSLFAERVLEGDWYVVLMELRSSPADALGPILGPGVLAMVLLSWLVQVALSAGVVEVLLEREGRHPFVLGVRTNLVRFLRTAVLLGVLAAVLAGAGFMLIRGFFKIAEAQSNGWYDLLGVALAAVLFVGLWAPLDLAGDLSRVAAARHDQHSMVRGFVRAWLAVLGRPGLFVPLYLVFLLLPLLLHALYLLLRSPWTPATIAGILALIVAQQAVMVVRSYLKLSFWGAEVAAFRGLEEPEWCRPKTSSSPEAALPQQPAEPVAWSATLQSGPEVREATPTSSVPEAPPPLVETAYRR